jgi:hypothetical protein
LILALETTAAQAAPVTIGQRPPTAPFAVCPGGDFDLAQLTVAAGSDYVVPPGYTEITSWSTYASEGVGQILTFKVFHLLGGLQYEVVGEDAEELTPEQVNTFQVEMHVAEDDVIGLGEGNASPTLPDACVFLTNNPGDTYGAHAPGALVGETETFQIEKDDRVNVEAMISAPPVLNLITPQSGAATGGTSVVIAGHEFSGARAVRFGKAPAGSFTVNSDNAITAVSPPGSGAETVDVTVTTAAGTTPTVEADRFTYVPVSPAVSSEAGHCVVPKLKGKRLRADRRRLRRAGCRLGKVRGHRARSARVRRQSVRPGTVLPQGSRVNVRVE